MTTTTPPTTGLLLPCPCCGEADATIWLDLSDGRLMCQGCDATFTAEDVRRLIERWSPVLTWLDGMPRREA